MAFVEAAVARADALRDSQQFLGAANAYELALSLAPSRADLWVQLGNMRKDAGQHDLALDAYNRALSIAPDDIDCRLQRGRALKLAGRNAEALQSFTEVLKRQQGHADTINEIIQLGEGWRAGGQLGPRLLGDILDLTAQMRGLIARVEAQLPTIRALNLLPVDQYDTYRSTFRIPPPPHAARDTAMFVLMLGDGPLEDILRIQHRVHQQTHAAFQLAMPELSGASAVAFERLCAVDPSRFIGLSGQKVGADEHIHALPENSIVVLCRVPVELDPECLAWMASIVEQADGVACVCSEDVVHYRDASRTYTNPLLRGACDPELLEQGIEYGTVVAARREPLISALRLNDDGTVNMAETLLGLMTLGKVEACHHPLVSRPAHIAAPAPALRRAAPATTQLSIAIIVPTRDQLPLLRRALDSARLSAASPGRLTFIVVDNGSLEPEMKDYLSNEASRERLTFVRVDEPFNWSRLNRIGVAHAPNADAYLFMNNDIEIMSAEWDLHLDHLLSRDNIGAVGAKLLYPDQTIQHAGIVATTDGMTIHDGKNKAGSASGPGHRYVTRRSVTAVTGAFIACRKSTFQELGGFDDVNLPFWFNDVDFCLKCWSSDLRVVYEPAIIAIHHESKTMASAVQNAERETLFNDARHLMGDRWKEQFYTEKWSITTLGR